LSTVKGNLVNSNEGSLPTFTLSRVIFFFKIASSLDLDRHSFLNTALSVPVHQLGNGFFETLQLTFVVLSSSLIP
jgi:hypothetical protein